MQRKRNPGEGLLGPALDPAAGGLVPSTMDGMPGGYYPTAAEMNAPVYPVNPMTMGDERSMQMPAQPMSGYSGDPLVDYFKGNRNSAEMSRLYNGGMLGFNMLGTGLGLAIDSPLVAGLNAAGAAIHGGGLSLAQNKLNQARSGIDMWSKQK